MLIKTILNRCYPFKRFVYGKVRMEGERLIVEILPRKNSHMVCSCCGKDATGYDQAEKREFEFISLWGISVYFRYRMRRVDCRECGVKVEKVPWAQGKSQICIAYQLLLAHWAKKLSWQEVAQAFKTSWGQVYGSVKMVVDYGMKKRNLDGIEAIGVDELYRGKKNGYVTLVYQIDEGARRLLFVGQERKAKVLSGFFESLGQERCRRIRYVCSDMWKPYLKVIREKLPQALHILDRFHIVAQLNKTLDKIRSEEARKFKKEGFEEILKNTKYCFLKNPKNLTKEQKLRLKDLLKVDLVSVKAYLLKEQFQHFWTYTSPAWAESFLKQWCTRTMRSKIQPLKKFVKTIREHHALIMNYFIAKKAYSSGVVEGLNRKINLTTRKSYGFKTFDALQIALFHTMGDLPEPNLTHRFY